MVFLNGWVLFGFIPLILIYHQRIRSHTSRQTKLLFSALSFMLLAFSEPALKDALSEQKFSSRDYVIALDASYSMQADDLKPTRYIMAKEAIKRLLKQHPKDRFTLFAFTSNALLISPPTTDSRISIQALEALNPAYILTKSTNLYQLFKTVSKSSTKEKSLIIFSDGGDEKDSERLINILKDHQITPFFVATATHRGAALKKGNQYLRDSRSALVISKINPMIKDLVQRAKGYYYTLSSPSDIDALSKDINRQKSRKDETIKVQSYQELFYLPLFIALLLFFIAITKLHQLIRLLPMTLLALMLNPTLSHAALLDFFYLDQASKAYDQAFYQKAARNFERLEPSVQSYYNTATAYYKARSYKKALHFYSRIKTTSPQLKAAIYYNMGNCAVQLKAYKKARQYYLFALTLNNKDHDAKDNLRLIHGLKEPKKPFDPREQKKAAQKNNETNKKQHQKKNEQQSASKKKSSANRNAQQSSSGAGGSKKRVKSGSVKKRTTPKPQNYKVGYKAYEIINKGYADEKEPW